MHQGVGKVASCEPVLGCPVPKEGYGAATGYCLAPMTRAITGGNGAANSRYGVKTHADLLL
jgi:hypothetical protein